MMKERRQSLSTLFLLGGYCFFSVPFVENIVENLFFQIYCLTLTHGSAH